MKVRNRSGMPGLIRVRTKTNIRNGEYIMRTLQEEQAVHTHLTKVRQYLESVASFVREQPSETKMTIRLGDNVTHMPAGQMSDLLKDIDKDVYSLQIMSEFAIAEVCIVDEDDIRDDAERATSLPKTGFMITDGHRYRASGQLMDTIVALFFERLGK